MAIAPVVGLIGATYHPYIGDLADNAETAAVVAADPTRWAWAHVIEMGGNVLLVLAVVWIGSYLRASGERLWSFIAVPLITVGIVLFTAVLGMSLSFSAMHEVGAPLEAVMDAVDPWYLPITLVILITAGLGFLSLAAAIYRSRALSRELTWVATAAIVMVALTLLSYPRHGASKSSAWRRWSHSGRSPTGCGKTRSRHPWLPRRRPRLLERPPSGLRHQPPSGALIGGAGFARGS